MTDHDRLIEQAVRDLLIVQSYDEIDNGTRTRRLRKDKAEKVARKIIAGLNKAIRAIPQDGTKGDVHA